MLSCAFSRIPWAGRFIKLLKESFVATLFTLVEWTYLEYGSKKPDGYIGMHFVLYGIRVLPE